MRLPFFGDMTFVIVVLFHGHPDKEGGQHREHVSLDEGNEQFHEGNEERHEQANRSHARGYTRPEERIERKDQSDEAQDYQRAGHHIREETNGQRRMLRKQANELNRDQDELDEKRHARWPEDVLPVVFGSVDLTQNKREGREHKRHRNIRRRSSGEGHQTQNIAEEDEEERGQQEGKKCLVFMTDVRACDFVPHEDHSRFEHVLKDSVRRGFATLTASVLPGKRNEYQQDEKPGQQAEDEVPRYRKIDDQFALERHDLRMKMFVAADHLRQLTRVPHLLYVTIFGLMDERIPPRR